MDGKFVKRLSPLLAVILILGIVALILVPIKLSQWPDVTGKLYILLMVLWGLGLAGFLAFWAGIFFANRGAYLHLDDSGISARFGFGTRLECSLESLNYIAVGPSMLTLESGGKTYDIAGLANVGDIARWFKERIPFIVPQEDRQALLIQRKRAETVRKKWIVALVVLIVMVFVNIGLLALLTGRRDMTDFLDRDFLLFYIFIAVELATFAAVFYCGGRSGKYIRQLAVSHDKLRILAIAKTPLPEGDYIGVFYDGRTQRLTLYADPEDRIYYILEALDGNFALQISCESTPSHDTYDVDRKIDQMRDIGFLFGLE